MVTLEVILDRKNLQRAMEQVARNKGAAGIDGYSAEDVRKWFTDHPYKLTTAVRNGSYKPSPIKRVYIPKGNGEKRPLGISTVADRTLQTALATVLSEFYDDSFSNGSHGFRPGRSCHTAMKQAIQYADEGYCCVVDMDLRKFFDTVNHSKLLQVLSKRIKDGRVIALVNKMLKAKVLDNKKLIPTTEGIPQGNAASPVLANILLNELDWELERRGHKFVRYADDMMIFCKSKRAAERTLVSISKFIEQKLFLQINKEKTSVSRLSPRVKFLGFGFYRNPKTGKWKPTVHKKSKQKLRKRIKEVLDRRCPRGIESTQTLLRQVLTGWGNYYRIALTRGTQIREVDTWIRRRIRQLVLKSWKRKWTRYQRLHQIYVDQWTHMEQACRRVAFSSQGYWALAQTANQALTNKWLKAEGWTWVASVLKLEKN